MAMIDTSRAAPFGATTSLRVRSAIEGVKTWFATLFAAQATAEELARLTPEQLEDIGLTPSDVIAARARAGII